MGPYLRLVTIAFCFTWAFADDMDLMELSLEELLTMDVTSATKTTGVTLQKAPSVIRVFTREDIDKFGFTTLYDMLSNVPGIQIQEYRSGHQLSWIRGVQARYNNKILWLIDGIPIRDSYYGHSFLDEGFPLEIVERVEVINGPGSVLYGANAFSGVVSIKTRQSGREVKAGYSSHSSPEGALYWTEKSWTFYGGFFDSEGFSPHLNNDGNAWEHNQDRERTSAMIRYKKGPWEAVVSATEFEYAENHRDSRKDRSISRDPAYGAIKYTRSYDDAFSVNLVAYYERYPLSKFQHRFDASGQITRIEREVFDTLMFGTDLDITYRTRNHTLVFGASFQHDEDDGMFAEDLFPEPARSASLAVSGVQRDNIGVFIQDMWDFDEKWALVTGMRFDHLSDFDNEWNWRVGLVTEQASFYGKLLVGSAYRVPSYREYLDVAAFNFDLEPEHMTTIELQIGKKLARSDMNLTFYRNSYDDFIKDLFVTTIREPDGDRVIDDEYAINAENREITGLEANIRYFPTDAITVRIGLEAVLDATETIGDIDSDIITSTENETAETDLFFLADFTFNAMIGYRFGKGHRVGANLFYFGDRDVPEGYQSGVPVENQDRGLADAFFKLDLYGKWSFSQRLALKAHVYNALDEEIHSPSFDDPAKFDNEWPGAEFRGTLTYKF